MAVPLISRDAVVVAVDYDIAPKGKLSSSTHITHNFKSLVFLIKVLNDKFPICYLKRCS